MTICTQPLDGVLAFFGALGFLLAIICTPIGAYQAFTMKEYGRKPGEREKVPGIFIVGMIGAGILVLVLILAFINQALPPICRTY